MAASRKILRADLKTYFAPLMTALQSQDDFFEYEPASYGSRSPIVYLNAAGSDLAWGTLRTLNSDFYINMHILALYADMTNEAYYEKQAADLLDDLRFQFDSALEAKRAYPGKWQDLSVEGRSKADEPEAIGGELYLHEVLLLKARLY